MNNNDGRRDDAWDEADILCSNPDNTVYLAKRGADGETALIYHTVIEGAAGAAHIQRALHNYRSLAEAVCLMPISTGRIGSRADGGYDVIVYAPPMERFDIARDITDPADALRCASALIGAVAALHGEGVTHGNICEGNLFRDGDGDVLLYGQLFPVSVKRVATLNGSAPGEPSPSEDLRALGRTVEALFAAAARTKDGSPGTLKYTIPMRAAQLLDALRQDPESFGGAEHLKEEWNNAFSHIVPYGDTPEAYDHLKSYTATFNPKASMVFMPAEASRFTTTVLRDAREASLRRRSAVLDIASVCAALASAAIYILIRLPGLPRYGAPF